MSNDEANNEPQGMAVLGIRMDDELRAKVREAARIEGRTESNFARFYLSKAAESVITEATAILPG